MSNLFFSPASGIASKTWTPGLKSYTQSNCQVTLTDNGYRIYRPPNLTVSANGNTMWGGLKLVNSSGSELHEYDSAVDNFFNLVKGHTYIIRFHVSGKSSNSPSGGQWGWTNQMGWGGHGLAPTPSNVSSHIIGANFNGEDECFYKFTINDDIVKTCTSSYSYATEGKQYLSYNHFGFGFGYTDTGTMGTDIYITNLRMYDITNGEKTSVNKVGQLLTCEPIEVGNIGSIQNGGDILGSSFYEY